MTAADRIRVIVAKALGDAVESLTQALAAAQPEIAVDVCIGRLGIAMLRNAGHEVLSAAHGEQDREWFAVAINAKADLVVSADADIEILAYDHRVDFFRARQGESGASCARRVIDKLSRQEVSR